MTGRLLPANLPPLDPHEMRNLIYSYGGLSGAQRYLRAHDRLYHITTIANWANGKYLTTASSHHVYGILLWGRDRYKDQIEAPVSRAELKELVRYHGGYIAATKRLLKYGTKIGKNSLRLCVAGKRGKKAVPCLTMIRATVGLRRIRDLESTMVPQHLRPYLGSNTPGELRPLVDMFGTPGQAARFVSKIGVKISGASMLAWYRRSPSTHFRPNRIPFICVMAALRFLAARFPGGVGGRVHTKRLDLRTPLGP